MNLVQEIFLELLEEAAPASLLCVASGTLPAAEAWLRHAPDCEIRALAPAAAREDLPGLGRYDYALLAGVLERLEPADAEAVVARVRDVHCHRFAVSCTHHGHGEDPWTPGRLASLSLSLHRRVKENGVEIGVYTYDIDTANPRREWNNPEDWAHPENFHRYRW